MSDKQNFFKNHSDAIAIVTVNLAICAIMISMFISHSSRIDSANSRIDNAIAISNAKIEKVTDMFYALLAEVKK